MDKCLIRKEGANIQPQCTEMTSNTVAQINKNRLTACKEKKGCKKKNQRNYDEARLECGFLYTAHIAASVCVSALCDASKHSVKRSLLYRHA